MRRPHPPCSMHGPAGADPGLPLLRRAPPNSADICQLNKARSKAISAFKCNTLYLRQGRSGANRQWPNISAQTRDRLQSARTWEFSVSLRGPQCPRNPARNFSRSSGVMRSQRFFMRWRHCIP